MSLRVLGLDLSHVGTGLARIVPTAGVLGSAAPSGVSVRTISTGARVGDERRHHILCEIGEEFRWQPQLAVIEAVFVGKDPTTGIRLAELHGQVQRALYLHDIPYVYVTAQQLKMYATGKGSGDKALVLHAARARYADLVGGPSRIADDNQADALTLAAMAAHAYGVPIATVDTQAGRALRLVEWPTVGANTPIPLRFADTTRPDGALL